MRRFRMIMWGVTTGVGVWLSAMATRGDLDNGSRGMLLMMMTFELAVAFKCDSVLRGDK